MRRTAVLVSFLAIPAVFAFGQPASTAEKVDVSTYLSADAVPAGGSIQLAVVLDIKEPWHVNAHRPTFDYLIGTEFAVQAREGVIVADVRYPKGHPVQFEFAEKPIDVYEGRAVVFLTLRFSQQIAPGADTLTGTLTAQACNDQVCLAPSRVEVVVPLTIASAGTSVTPANAEVFSLMSTEVYERPNDGQGDLAGLFEREGSAVAFFAIFLIGLALNLTPCVYPMLSVTVSLFGGQSDTNVARVFLKAVVYVLGISSMYTALGVSAAFSGGLFGSWLQSPWVLGAVALLLFGLALSSFGLYQLQLPYWLTSRLGGQTGTGLIGLYLSGLVVGVFAAPCTGPPVIALLTLVGAKGDPMFGFQAFFSLSMGLGFPYLILGTFSGLLGKIPRSGPWLVWVERIFGVVLTGAALFYLLLAIAPRHSVLVIPVVLILGGLYLGFLDHSGRGKKGLQRVQWAFGGVCIVFGLMTASSLATPGITWEPYSAAVLAEARDNNQPVVMDFYADWCIPCLELDRNTFTNAEVIDGTKDVRRIKVDLTHFDSPEAEQLRKQFDIAGVPTVVFMRGDGVEERGSRIVGFVPPEEFLARLKPIVQK